VTIEGIDDERMDLTDYYLSVDKRSLQGVSEADAQRALAGDGAMAYAIANEFGASNYLTEARFWFQIAAENGDARGMLYYAIYMDPISCHRANYWRRRALNGDLPVSNERRAQIERRLREGELECKSKQ